MSRKCSMTQDEKICSSGFWIGIMLGTDSSDSPYGVGPKTEVKIVRDADNFDEVVYQAYEEDESLNRYRWYKVLYLFHEPNVDLDIDLDWHPTNEEKVQEILIGRHGFDPKRVNYGLEKIQTSVGEEFAAADPGVFR